MKFNRILTVTNEPGQPERVPGLIGAAYIRKIPLVDAKALMGLDGLDGYFKILEISLCDNQGNPLTTDEINNIPFDATKALADIASDWNGLSEKSSKDLEKN
jgi:hypothetical protein